MNSSIGRRVLLPAAALLRQHARPRSRPGASASPRPGRATGRGRRAAARPAASAARNGRGTARCARARCGPRTGRNRRSTRRSPSCRAACRDACRTGRCARRRSRAGAPTTRLCRMPSRGCACMMRTSRTMVVAGHQAVGVERQHEFEVAPQRLAEVAHIAGLEAGVLVAPAVDEAVRAGSATSRRQAASAASSAAATAGIVGVAQDEIGEALRPRPVASRLRFTTSSRRRRAPGPRCAGHQDGGAQRGSARPIAPRRRRARPRRGRRARPCSSQSPISGVPEAEHASRAPRRGSRRTERRRRPSSRPRRGPPPSRRRAPR